MNRRGFISTLTALAGVVLAKIKAPPAPSIKFQNNGVELFRVPLTDPVIAKWRQLGNTRSQLALLEYYRKAKP